MVGAMGIYRVVVAFMGLTLASACGGDPPAPTTVAPPNFTVVSDAKVGFAVAIPTPWQQIPLSTNLDTFDRDANRLRQQNPKLSSAIVIARELSGSGGSLMAVAADGQASVNLTSDKAEEADLDNVSRKIVEALLKNGAQDPVASRVTVADNPAVRLAFKSPIQTDTGSALADQVQFIVLQDEKVYILTVLNAPDAADVIAKSLRLRS